MIKSLENLIDRAKNKDGLSESDMWRALIEMPGTLFVVTNEKFNFHWANNYFFDYFKCHSEDIKGKPMHGFLGEDVLCDMNEKHIERVLKEKQVYDYYARTTRADGELVTIRWHQCVITPGANKNGDKAWIFSVGFPNENASVDVLDRSVTVNEKVEYVPVFSGIHTPSDEDVTDIEIDRCLSEEYYVLHYQPRVDVRTKKVESAEGLLRMNHPERGILLPSSFLPSMEKSGHILQIGSYVIEMACKKLHECQDSGMGISLSLSVNISPNELYSPKLMQNLLATTTRYRLKTDKIMIEISERTVALHYNKAKKIFRVLKEAGFKVAIDDYSSKYLPLDALCRLKLDNITISHDSIVRSDTEQKTRLLIESVMLLVRGLNVKVTASGLENRKQLDFLRDNSVDYLQGFLISEPLPEAEFDRFLKTNPDFYARHV